MAELQLPTVKCTTVNIGQAPVITITNVIDATHWTLTWEFGSQSGTIATRTQATLFNNYVWSTYFYNEIPDATMGVGYLILDCYSGNSHIGTTTTTFKVLVNASISAPTISLPSVRDTNANTVRLTGNDEKIIRHMSQAAVTVRAEARNGASLAYGKVSNGLQAFNLPFAVNPTSVGVINKPAYPTFKVQATDSRGLTTTINYEMPAEDFIEYVLPTCNIGGETPDTDGKISLTCSGNYYSGMFSATVGNTIEVRCRYKEKDGTYGSWQYMTISSIQDNRYSAYINITGLDYRKTYIFECQIGDELMTVTSAEWATRAIPVFHWGEDDFVFEVPVTFKQGATGIESGGGDAGGDQTITGNQTITGDLRLKGSGNYGNSLYFGDGYYCYLKEETDDDLTIKATDLNLNVSNLYLNGGAIKAGSWTPTLTTAAAVSSYTTRSGWYVRVGNVVTVGFNIGASCNSGYNSTALAISGLPFTPSTNAFGGGVMFGAYVTAGFCFEAWAAATNGQITPRLQPCNNTAAGNLQIASTAYYPSGANSVTLGGTITYITND